MGTPEELCLALAEELNRVAPERARVGRSLTGWWAVTVFLDHAESLEYQEWLVEFDAERAGFWIYPRQTEWAIMQGRVVVPFVELAHPELVAVLLQHLGLGFPAGKLVVFCEREELCAALLMYCKSARV